MAAVREPFEETGLILGHRMEQPPRTRSTHWQPFFRQGFVPALDKLGYFARAITPPGRPRRFDARFFLADAAAIAGDSEDFSRATEELSHLHWVPVATARRLNLPFITEVVLEQAEITWDSVLAVKGRGAWQGNALRFRCGVRASVWERTQWHLALVVEGM